MEKSVAEGSITFEEAIAKLVISGKVSREEALANADSVTNLVWRLQNDAAPISRATPKADESDGPVYTDFIIDIVPDGLVERRATAFPPLS